MITRISCFRSTFYFFMKEFWFVNKEPKCLKVFTFSYKLLPTVICSFVIMPRWHPISMYLVFLCLLLNQYPYKHWVYFLKFSKHFSHCGSMHSIWWHIMVLAAPELNSQQLTQHVILTLEGLQGPVQGLSTVRLQDDQFALTHTDERAAVHFTELVYFLTVQSVGRSNTHHPVYGVHRGPEVHPLVLPFRSRASVWN